MRFLQKYVFALLITFLISIIILKSRSNTQRLSKIVLHAFINNYNANSEEYKTLQLQPFDDRFNRYENWINTYMSNIVPGLGDLGEPAYSSANEKILEIKTYSKKAINVLLSNKISLDRSLPDVRNLQCRDIAYDIQLLPSASVVIIFYNEPWSVLLRTVHSVIRKTPPNLLKEIILVDDNSDEEELKESLSYYVETRLPLKVRIVRLPYRQGLIRARLEGAKNASGDVLVFLDAHCEVIKEWLEPLLLRIKEKRNTVVTPLVDVISATTLRYKALNFTAVGGFSWRGAFIADVMREEVTSISSSTSPVPTPVMYGGLFAVDRKYFWELGGYDEKMTGWGGENLEISFRTWQCGGSLEVIPCSRVGHIFRTFFPYKMPSGTSVLNNLQRTVNVWMDDYSRLFYLFNRKVEFGDIQDRLELRKRLNCRSFKWYLQNVYPEKFVFDENVVAYGKVSLSNRNLCLQEDYEGKYYYKLKFASCKEKLSHMQTFSLTNSGLLRTEFQCAKIETETLKIVFYNCNTVVHDKWQFFENGSLINLRSGFCLDASGLESGHQAGVDECNGSVDQIWKFVH